MHTPTALLLLLIALVTLPTVSAFGAGNIPSIAFVEGKAFRHGDIEDVIASLVLSQGAISLLSKKFGGLDVKRVYFGNWLRDYSQAIDVGTLSKGLNKTTLVTLVSILGFLAFGYATAEFEVTEDRLGCYRAEEHIDNPKGYADGQDARKYDPGLRGPVDPRELEIDPRTGLKNYIANEGGGWPTSSAFVRATLERAIQAYRSGNEYEGFRLLGTALHTLEDYPAHSNFVELALIELGYDSVFPFVGEATAFRQGVDSRTGRNRPIYPIVTGTFGGADFVHSLLGEATDHVSAASISSLNSEMEAAKRSFDDNSLPDLLSKVPGMEDVTRQVRDVERAPVSTDPAEMKASVWKILELRDRIVKGVEMTIEKIPGLSWLSEKISETVQVFVLTQLEPYMKPIMQQVVGKLQNTSAEIVNADSQREIFTNPHCSDPTHSLLSKDHFDLFLNEPAGLVAKVIVEHIVKAVVKAWSTSDASATSEAINLAMQVFVHPANLGFAKTPLQTQMLDVVRKWADENRSILGQLDKASVMAGRNRRHPETAGRGCGGGYIPPPQPQAQATYGQSSGAYGQQGPSPSGYGHPPSSGYGNQTVQPSGYGNQGAPSSGYGHPPSSGYGNQTVQPSGYGNQAPPSSGYGHPPSSGYGNQTVQPSGYGNQAAPSSGYGHPPGSGYGDQTVQPPGYGNAPPSSGYGAQPPQPSGYGHPPSSGYGAQPTGYGTPYAQPQGYSAQPPVQTFPQPEQGGYPGAGYEGSTPQFPQPDGGYGSGNQQWR
ncbi:uncharacterized protein SPPG_01813 [Spizellomyces punctatus DAOM BR117]|uniref:Het-C-domain-containing protein n=1 Tax=Spizellomyces punctatus (strain DAOM BR117) TaxID=645134 RepID=A0A0L0HP42_SPIPD|nr:uncharacterized protein SPPG_01813 [Spizellomyces punctatus DAOM BR117]KND02730.1 hypothetical protein SPPG_01813 [Spizellomyces punctatus DAOM BR117]|eukprot:XP_016610769.1 hypothetical protein SPPG_01813 [Spizellomyces punctatus DAOM BR117]